jgi:hypothetical protein
MAAISVSTLVDTFTGSFDSAWNANYGGVSVVSGRGRTPVTTSYTGIYSTEPSAGNTWTFSGASIHVELPTVPVAGGATSEAYCNVSITSSTAGTYVGILYDAIADQLRCRSTSDWWDPDVVTVNYSATDHRWLRIRHASSVLYFDTSPDSVTWTNQRTIDPAPAWLASDTVGVLLEGYRTDGTNDYADWDNVNVVSSSVSPAAIAASASVPAPTVIVSTNATVTPDAIAAVTSIPAHAVKTESTVVAIAIAAVVGISSAAISTGIAVNPDAIAATTTIAATTINTGTTVSSDVLAGTAIIPTVTVRTGSTVSPASLLAAATSSTPAVTTGTSTEPTALAAITSILSTTIATGSTATPDAVATTVASSSPTVTAGMTVDPTTLTALSVIPAVTITIGATTSPDTLTTVTAIPSVTVTAESPATVEPSALDATAIIPTVTINTGTSIAPAALSLVATVSAPTVTTESTVTAETLAVAAAIPSPTISTGSSTAVAPTTVAAAVTIPSSVISVDTTVSPTTLSVVVAIVAPAISSDVIVAPTTPALAASLPALTISTGAAATVTSVDAVAVLPAVTVATESTANLDPLVVSATIPTPVVSSGTGTIVTPNTLTATVTISVATVSGEIAATPTTLTLTTIIPAPTINVGESTTVSPNTLAAVVTVPSPAVSPLPLPALLPPGVCMIWDPIWTCRLPTGSYAVTGQATSIATEVLYALTGRQFGLCTKVIRPCRASCFGNVWPSADWWDINSGMAYPQPLLIGGQWFNLTCGSCTSGCSCSTVSEAILPGPVYDILEVKVDGVVLTPIIDYRLDDWRLLVRLNGESWPLCNNLNLADTEVGTWSVTLRAGVEVPELGQLAVGELATDIVKFLVCDDTCTLPKPIQSITRQGLNISFLDPNEVFADGKLGMYFCDLFIQTYNPNKLKQRSRVYNIDDLASRRHIGS